MELLAVAGGGQVGPQRASARRCGWPCPCPGCWGLRHLVHPHLNCTRAPGDPVLPTSESPPPRLLRSSPTHPAPEASPPGSRTRGGSHRPALSCVLLLSLPAPCPMLWSRLPVPTPWPQSSLCLRCRIPSPCLLEPALCHLLQEAFGDLLGGDCTPRAPLTPAFLPLGSWRPVATPTHPHHSRTPWGQTLGLMPPVSSRPRGQALESERGAQVSLWSPLALRPWAAVSSL